MKHLIRNIMVCGVVAAMSIGLGGSASAASTAAPDPAWSRTPTVILVAKEVTTNAILAMIYPVSNPSSCSVFALLGYEGRLSDDWEVRGTEGIDTIIMPNFASACGHLSYVPLDHGSFNGHYLDLRGLGGNDVVLNYLAEETWVFLDNGDDIGYSNSPNGALLGGEGNDALTSGSSGGGETLQGDQGLDCLCDGSLSAAVFDCDGQGVNYNNSDQRGSSCTPLNHQRCEIPVATCMNQ